MRIGIDCRMYGKNFTGIGTYNQMFITELSKLDKKNEYILFVNENHSELDKLPSNFKCILVESPIYSLKEQTKFLIELYKQNLDLMHFTNFNQPLLYFKKQISTIHDLTLFYSKGNKHNSIVSRIAFYITFFKSISFAKKILVVSKHTKKDLIKKFKFTQNKITLHYLGFKKTSSEVKKIDLLKENKFLLYAGNWREHKNIPNLIKAFNILKKDPSFKYKLVLTGKPNPLYPEVLDLIKDYKLEKEVILTGLISEKELNFLYKNASLYVQPSFYEGFGLPILEALSFKTQVAASNTSCIPEIGGDQIHYFNPKNPKNIAKTILFALKNPIKLEDKYLKKFNWQKTSEIILNTYNNV